MRRAPGVAAVLLATVGWTVSAGPPAGATTTSPSASTRGLCDGSPVACSVQVSPTWVEGRSGEVAVTGRPGTTVGIRAFRVSVDAHGVSVLTPFGPVATMTTDANGFAAADLRLPVVPEGESGGPILFAPHDSVGGDLTTMLGTWSTVTSRRPLVLGDGFGTAKPVGEPLELVLAAVVPTTGFVVELQRDGTWVPVGTGSACAGGTTPCTITYEVPRGLHSRPHAVRLVNEATGTPVADWQVVPTDTGTTRARATVQMPAVGANLPGSVGAGAGSGTNAVPRPRTRELDVPVSGAVLLGGAESSGHSPAVVRRAAGLFAVVAGVVAIGGAFRGMRRRPASGR